MKSKILLINFTEKEAEKLKALPLKIDRGFLGDIRELTKREAALSTYSGDKRTVDDIDFYSPYPVYEYKAVFINLNHNESLQKEFESKTKKLTEEDRKDFANYWLLLGNSIVIFLGDYQFRDLYNLGIPEITLKEVVNQDLVINSRDTGSGREMTTLFNKVKSGVIMPTNYYIQIDKESLFINDTAVYKRKYIYWNNNGNDIAIFIDYNKGYSSSDRPRLVILPQFKIKIMIVERFLWVLAKIFPKHLPELPHSDWVDSDQYYPTEIVEYDSKIDTFVTETQTKIEELKKQKEKAKEKYKSLRGLITETGDELKDNVIDVLRSIFKISVEDGDKLAGLPNEDIIINFKNVKILAEVKGVKVENPSPLFIGQLWKHLSQSEDKEINKGALILNHDRETDPKDRSLAYGGEHEKGLKDIIFIDTRVMFSLGLAIIDHSMSSKEAALKLFRVGRVCFSLDEYLRSKKSIKEK